MPSCWEELSVMARRVVDKSFVDRRWSVMRFLGGFPGITAAALLALALQASVGSAQLSREQQPPEDPKKEGVIVRGASILRKFVPAETLETQSLQQYKQMLDGARSKSALAPDSHPQVLRLRNIAQKIIPHTKKWNPDSDKWKWEINLIGSPQLNAFCMPGGKIAFFLGIIDKLHLSDDEVAIVMGHEMAHALREHARARFAKVNAANIGARTIAAVLGLGQLGDAAAQGAAQLLTLKFSRGDESEADLIGMDLAARAGYDPRAGVSLWQKMSAAAQGAPPQWMSTHPASTTRIADMRKQMERVLPLYARATGQSVSGLKPYDSNLPHVRNSLIDAPPPKAEPAARW
jgi:predicted Zn-dependent protease